MSKHKIDIYYYKISSNNTATLMRAKQKSHPGLFSFIIKQWPEIVEGYRTAEEQMKLNNTKTMSVLGYSFNSDVFDLLLKELGLTSDRQQKDKVTLFKGLRKPLLTLNRNKGEDLPDRELQQTGSKES